MIDPDHPFYEPLWRRIVIPAICFVWAGVELYSGSVTWAIISAALGLFAGYKLLVEKRKAAPATVADEAPTVETRTIETNTGETNTGETRTIEAGASESGASESGTSESGTSETGKAVTGKTEARDE